MHDNSTQINIKNTKIIATILIFVPIIAFIVSICLGRYWVAPKTAFKILASRIFPMDVTWSSIEESVVLQIRLPRIIMAMLVGAGLAVSGAAFQGLFGNPMVSPQILGASAGAGFGAALGILMSGQMAIVQLLAIAFSALAVSITYMISHIKTESSLFMLVLSGMITQAFFTALISLTKYVADPEEVLPTIVYWLMGSMSGISYDDLWIGIPMIAIGVMVLLLMRWRINVLSLNEEEARSLGINVQQSRLIVIAASTLITAAAVSLCGIIGWVGLVIPHIGRMFAGPDHRALLPASVSIGALYLLIIDDIARTATAAEIPLSILTAIVGAPFFAYLLRKTGGKWS